MTITYKKIKSTKNSLTANVEDGMVAIIVNVGKTYSKEHKGSMKVGGRFITAIIAILVVSATCNADFLAATPAEFDHTQSVSGHNQVDLSCRRSQ